MNRLLGYLLGFGVLGVAIMWDGNLCTYFNLPSVAICVGGVFFFALAVHSPKALVRALRAAFGDAPLSAEQAREHECVLDTLTNLTLTMGILGCLIGFVQMLQNMDDPKKIGPALAVALLTVLYGTIFGGLVFGPLRYRLRLKVKDDGEPRA